MDDRRRSRSARGAAAAPRVARARRAAAPRGRPDRRRPGSPRAPGRAPPAPRRPRAGRRRLARELVHRRQVAQLHARKATARRSRRVRLGASRGSVEHGLDRLARVVGEREQRRDPRARPSRRRARCRAPSRAAASSTPSRRARRGSAATLPVWISVSDSNSSSAVPKPPGKTHEALRRLHEHRLARVEVVEGEREVEVGVRRPARAAARC